ncbi:hypothetical protein DESC_820021 [Desulfosarcina cetonica]|nr:hypothetical protein DESC_820021 [Desulfosarcina cetonica]
MPACDTDTGCSLKEDRTKALLVLEFFVLFSEPLDTAGRIHQLLFAGEKRVAFGTNFHTNVLLGRADFDGVAADALNGRLLIIRMDVGFHWYFNPL